MCPASRRIHPTRRTSFDAAKNMNAAARNQSWDWRTDSILPSVSFSGGITSSIRYSLNSSAHVRNSTATLKTRSLEILARESGAMVDMAPAQQASSAEKCQGVE